MTAALSKRDFSRARYGLQRDLARACRAAVAGTPWRSREAVLVGQRAGWLTAVHPLVNLLHERTDVRLTVKPMASDPIFWDLVGHPELRRQGLSFRYFGAMTVAGLILEEVEVPEDGGPEAIAGRMLELGERTLTTLETRWSIDDFLDGLPPGGGRYFTARIATLLAYGRDADAKRLCEESAAAGSSGGFLSSAHGTFNEMTQRFVAAKEGL